MPTTITFADLTHTGQVVAANTFPLGSGMVVAYAKKELGDDIDIEIFKYPDDLAARFDRAMPQIACFTSFSWNIRLHHEYAKRVKALSPSTITIFGGCNFPEDRQGQQEYLAKYPAIDFYIEFEGELAFVELYRQLKEIGFDAARFKREQRQSPNVRYLVDGELVATELGPKIRDMSVVPSPHLTGVLDKFYDDVLIPMMQTTRGCPYHCTFCWEGGSFFNKIGRFSQERIRDELDYIAARTNKVPDLCITDANFGMFEDDLDTSRAILEVQKKHKHGWPKSVLTATAKNHKERTIEIVELLGATLPPTAAVQSTDPIVLDKIKRKNPPTAVLDAMGRVVDKHGGQSEAELILCLPGDNKQAHFRTVADMLDAGMTFIRMYQFMLLPGTEAASRKSRIDNEMTIRFRVLPRCFGYYRFRNEKFGVAEIEEICVANKTMPYEDYQACRNLHLSVEIFSNDSIFSDLLFFLGRYGIKRSEFIQRAYGLIVNGHGHMAKLYADFRAEEKKNLWDDLAKVEAFTRAPGTIDRYIAGEYGTNELYKYRALSVFDGIEPLHEVAFEAASSLLEEAGKMTEKVAHYLGELAEFSLMRKRDPLNTDRPSRGRFHYDFVALLEERFMADPFLYEVPAGVDIVVDHTPAQRELVHGYVKQYGTTLIGLGRILIRANMGRLYRSAKTIDQDGAVLAGSTVPERERLGRFGAIG